jgi:hypothetical protein
MSMVKQRFLRINLTTSGNVWMFEKLLILTFEIRPWTFFPLAAAYRADWSWKGSAESNVCLSLSFPAKPIQFEVTQKYSCFMLILHFPFCTCSVSLHPPALTAVTKFSQFPPSNSHTVHTVLTQFPLYNIHLPSAQTSQLYMKHVPIFM